MKPYVYLIGWTKLDTWYCGSRYSKNCLSTDLWKTYFTSSKHVKRFHIQHGEPDHIEILKECITREEAILFEIEKLKEFDVLNKTNWLNRTINGTRFRFGPHSKETILKISQAKKNPSEQTRRNISNGMLGKKRKPWSDEMKLRISQGNKGVKRSEETKLSISIAKNNISEETRKKMSEAAKNRKYKNKAVEVHDVW